MNDTRIYYAGTYVRYMLGSITIFYPCISGMYSCPKNSNFKLCLRAVWKPSTWNHLKDQFGGLDFQGWDNLNWATSHIPPACLDPKNSILPCFLSKQRDDVSKSLIFMPQQFLRVGRRQWIVVILLMTLWIGRSNAVTHVFVRFMDHENIGKMAKTTPK